VEGRSSWPWTGQKKGMRDRREKPMTSAKEAHKRGRTLVGVGQKKEKTLAERQAGAIQPISFRKENGPVRRNPLEISDGGELDGENIQEGRGCPTQRRKLKFGQREKYYSGKEGASAFLIWLGRKGRRSLPEGKNLPWRKKRFVRMKGARLNYLGYLELGG